VNPVSTYINQEAVSPECAGNQVNTESKNNAEAHYELGGRRLASCSVIDKAEAKNSPGRSLPAGDEQARPHQPADAQQGDSD